MRKVTTALAAGLGGALLWACAGGGRSSEGIVDFSAQLQPTTGYQVTGTANAVASIGRTAVTVEIANATPGATHPWHVHRGTCGSNGPIVGSASDYPTIKVDTDGSERAVATLGLQLDDDTPYFVNVHLSPQQMGTIVACGALVD